MVVDLTRVQLRNRGINVYPTEPPGVYETDTVLVLRTHIDHDHDE